MLSETAYHSGLRIALVVVALMVVFDSGLWSRDTAVLSDHTAVYLANAIGVSVGVAPTELNQITAALTARERELDERELAIAEREIAVDLGTSATTRNTQTSTFILATILFILLVLVIVNYILDYVRIREQIDRRSITL